MTKKEHKEWLNSLSEEEYEEWIINKNNDMSVYGFDEE